MNTLHGPSLVPVVIDHATFCDDTTLIVVSLSSWLLMTTTVVGNTFFCINSHSAIASGATKTVLLVYYSVKFFIK